MTTNMNVSARPAEADRAAPIHVLLVDDHPSVRHGVRQLISDQPDMVTIAEHGSATSDSTAVARWADVAVIDYHLGDRDGLWLTRQIKQRPCPPPVLIYSAFADTTLAVAASSGLPLASSSTTRALASGESRRASPRSRIW